MRIESVPVQIHRGVEAVSGPDRLLGTFTIPASASWATHARVYADVGSTSGGVIRLRGVGVGADAAYTGSQNSVSRNFTPTSFVGKTIEIMGFVNSSGGTGLPDTRHATWLRSAHCVLSDRSLSGNSALAPSWVGSIPEAVIGEAGEIAEAEWSATSLVRSFNIITHTSGGAPPNPPIGTWWDYGTSGPVIPVPLDPAWDGKWLWVQLQDFGSSRHVSRYIPITVL